MVPTLVNGRWEIMLPRHRAERAEWSTAEGWERARLDSMYEHLKPGHTIVDVGAEEGDLPGLWSSWGCDVALIEPSPPTWANIRAVWEGNSFDPPAGMFVGFASDVTELSPPHRYSVEGNPNALATGYRMEADGWPICTRGPVIADHGFAHLSQQDDSIPQVTLDDFAEHHGLKVDAITIDVEGSELRVLQGARGVLAYDRPLVWVSVHADRDWQVAEYGGADRADVDAYMAGYGYTAELLAVDHEIHVLYYPNG